MAGTRREAAVDADEARTAAHNVARPGRDRLDEQRIGPDVAARCCERAQGSGQAHDRQIAGNGHAPARR
jgi:hypothetical protein